MLGPSMGSDVLLQTMTNKGKMELHLTPSYIFKHDDHDSSYGTIVKGTKLSYVG